MVCASQIAASGGGRLVRASSSPLRAAVAPRLRHARPARDPSPRESLPREAGAQLRHSPPCVRYLTPEDTGRDGAGCEECLLPRTVRLACPDLHEPFDVRIVHDAREPFPAPLRPDHVRAEPPRPASADYRTPGREQ